MGVGVAGARGVVATFYVAYVFFLLRFVFVRQVASVNAKMSQTQREREGERGKRERSAMEEATRSTCGNLTMQFSSHLAHSGFGSGSDSGRNFPLVIFIFAIKSTEN